MKQILSLFLILALGVTLSACGSGGKKDERVLSDVVKVFEDAGIEVDLEEKPFFQMIGASDGVIFYIDNQPVKIYEFTDAKTLEQAVKDYEEVLKDWPTNGKFLLETSNEQAIELFNGVE